MSEEFTMSPKTSVADAVKDEKTQLDRIEAKMDQILEMMRTKAAQAE